MKRIIHVSDLHVDREVFKDRFRSVVSNLIREKGHEYGTTTGRPRRCGWFDGVVVKYSAKIGGIDQIAMMHLDTLAGMKELSICRAYEIDGVETTFFPADVAKLAKVKCIYQTTPGWDEDLSKITNFGDLPSTVKDYLAMVEDIVKIPVKILGVGPKRSQVIFRP